MRWCSFFFTHPNGNKYLEKHLFVSFRPKSLVFSLVCCSSLNLIINSPVFYWLHMQSELGASVSGAHKHDGCINSRKTWLQNQRQQAQTTSLWMKRCHIHIWSVDVKHSNRTAPLSPLCLQRPLPFKRPHPAAASSSSPSSSPMRSSFQVQQSSINLIHFPLVSSGEPLVDREPVTDVPQRPHRSALPPVLVFGCASVDPRSCSGPRCFLLPAAVRSVLRRFIQQIRRPMEWQSRGEENIEAGQPGTRPS